MIGCGRLAERVVERVPHDAGDDVTCGRAPEADGPAARAVEVAPHELLVDDRLRRQCRVLEIGEVRPRAERNAHDREVARRDGVRERLVGPCLGARAAFER